MSELPEAKYRRATVWWHDAYSSTKNYDYKEALRLHKAVLCADTGWVVVDDETGISLADQWNARSDDDQDFYEFRGYRFRPRAMIVRVEYLTPDLT